MAETASCARFELLFYAPLHALPVLRLKSHYDGTLLKRKRSSNEVLLKLHADTAYSSSTEFAFKHALRLIAMSYKRSASS